MGLAFVLSSLAKQMIRVVEAIRMLYIVTGRLARDVVLRKRPEAVLTPLNLLRDEGKVQGVSLYGYLEAKRLITIEVPPTAIRLLNHLQLNNARSSS